jgi:uncharacterized membrane protein YdjX (TVP38/TMEM64 family)
MPWREYALGTALGSPPHVAFFVYLGSLLSSVEDLISGKTSHSSMYYAANMTGVVLSIWIAVYTVQITRREIAVIQKDRAKDSGLGMV